MSRSRIILAMAVAVAVVGLTLKATGRTPIGSLPPDAVAHLARLQNAPDLAGPAIYVGSVFAPEAGLAPVYRYERRVRRIAGGLESMHITVDPSGHVVVVQSATHSAVYALRRADLVHGQTGFVGSVEASDGTLTFTHVEDGRTTVTTEQVTAPVVAGPTMFGYIITHWDELERGASLPIQFAIIERQESIGFTLDRIPAAAGRTAIRMRPSSRLMRLVVPSTAFEFETATRKILEYTGRVPPMEVVNGALNTLDARVTYEFKAPAFR